MAVYHILKNGEMLDDITGHVVELEDSGPLYQILADISQEKTKLHNSNKGKKNEVT